MLRWISIFGGLLIMMGHHARSEALFYYFRLEDQVPENHLLRLVSTTDPDSTYATKGGTPARLGYYDNYLVDNHSCVIVGVQATAARMSQETVAAQDMITRFMQWQGREPASVAADATYGNGEFLQWLLDRGITPYMRTRDSALRKNNPGYGPERFTYLPESNRYRCRRRATELCRLERSQSCPCLYRQRQTLRSMLPKSAMHNWTI